jgi:hypothetical protein
MAKAKEQRTPATEDLLRDLMIVQLGLAGVTQQAIRKIVGVDMHRVNRIVRHLKDARRPHA